MADKILLSTYVINIEEKKVPQKLNQLVENQNFLDIFEFFCTNIMKQPFIPKARGRFTDKSLTIPSSEILKGMLPFTIKEKDRAMYGYFQAGTGGDNFDIMNSATNAREFAVQSKKHISTKNIFYYLHVPENSTEGYLILQKIRNFGIKTDLTNALQVRLKNLLPKGFIVQIYNRVPYDLYQEMIKYGTLKKVEFIKNSIPASMKDFVSNNKKARRVKGSMTHTLKARGGFAPEWLKTAGDILKGTRTSNQRIDFLEEEESFDEISFEIELDGKKKTFHAINQQKVQPSVDVTESITLDDNNIPTLDSLIKISKELIEDITKLQT